MNVLKVVYIEDDPVDVEMVSRKLLSSEYFQADIKSTDNHRGFLELLQTFAPDLILADYCLPAYSGIDALKTALAYDEKIPFIFVSGVIGEELAAETVLLGASGFVLKSNISKLNEIIGNILTGTNQKSANLNLMTTTAMRIKKQIQANNEMMEMVRGMIGNT